MIDLNKAYRHSWITGVSEKAFAALQSAWFTSQIKKIVTYWNFALQHSKTVDTTQKIGHYLSKSRIYGWFASEPEPKVVVIDLSKTMSFYLILPLFDRVFSELKSAWLSSYLHVATSKIINRISLAHR